MVESMITEARPEDRESVSAAFDYSNRTMEVMTRMLDEGREPPTSAEFAAAAP